MKNTIDSGLKCVATGSDPKTDQTNLFAQFLNVSLEKVKFDSIYPIF